MENENINTNATDTQMNSTNESKSERFANEALTANTNYGTISSADIENGTAELVLIPPFEGDDGGISVACVEGDDSSCNMASQTDRDNATLLTLDQWKCDSITDTVSERWYKFYVSDYATYTIYTTGSTNTTGRLYDYAGNLITINDDRAGSLNFRIVYPLSVDPYESDSGWYYVKVTTPQTETGEFHIRVVKRVLVSQVTVSDANVTLDIGETYTLSASVYPDNADNKRISFSSYNTDVATIDPDTGVITALSPGIANICAFDWNNDGEPGRCEVWVRGKTPVFLIHGRNSHSADIWGANNSVCFNWEDPKDRDNNEFKSSEYANVGNQGYQYIDINTQKLCDRNFTGVELKVDGNETDFVLPAVFNGQFKKKEYISTHPEYGNLAYALKQNGYIENINLFAFNYPNRDVVKNDAEKFKKYIENLISYIKISNSDDARLMKFYFYPSRDDYNNNNYKFNIVGHSMGGLVARYYIENLEQDSHVHKLITICTPHWGSDLANLSNSSSIAHLLCDHDLDTNSAMYGGNNSDILNGGCSQVEITDLWTKCTDSTYALTDPLNYLYSPETIYYAIAGIDFDAIGINLPNLSFELDNFNTYDDLLDNIQAKAQDIAGTSLRELIDGSDYPVTRPIDVKIVTDNTVGFLSQIGWTRDYGDTPQKKVTMHKVFVNIDTNGGNDIVDHFHGKMTHRKCVIDCVIAYLLE